MGTEHPIRFAGHAESLREAIHRAAEGLFEDLPGYSPPPVQRLNPDQRPRTPAPPAPSDATDDRAAIHRYRAREVRALERIADALEEIATHARRSDGIVGE